MCITEVGTMGRKKAPRGKAAPYRTGELSLTQKEYDKLLSACDNLQDRMLIMVGCSLGLRRSDIVRLEWDNIDYTNMEIRYREKKKGDRIRVVPIGPKLTQELKIMQNASDIKRKTLFTFGDRQAYTRFNKVCERAGIPKRPFHALRATAIKRMQAAGWKPEEVAEIVGDSIRTIQEHYATPSRSELAEAAREREVV